MQTQPYNQNPEFAGISEFELNLITKWEGDAYQQGKEAFKHGLTESDSLFYGTRFHESWLAGFEFAKTRSVS